MYIMQRNIAGIEKFIFRNKKERKINCILHHVYSQLMLT
jgi:hypothetical protein